MLKLNSTSILVGTILLSSLLTSCSKRLEETPAYQATCQGSPLRTATNRNKAMEDGYNINRQYDCIEKASFMAVEAQSAEWKAANTPEAIAQRIAERKEMVAAAQVAAERKKEAPSRSAFELRNVDVNTATESDLIKVPSIDSVTAAQILDERQKGRFKNWDDLVNRVVGLSAAISAARASACGLNVDGQSLLGVPPDPVVATKLYNQSQENTRP
jgi:hypothetical protein